MKKPQITNTASTIESEAIRYVGDCILYAVEKINKQKTTINTHSTELGRKCESLYEKLQESKYYKELGYIEKQIYLSAVEDVIQAISAISNKR